MACCFGMKTLPRLLLLLAQDTWTFFLFAILFGIGVGGEVPIFPVINRQYYGHAPMGTLYGWQNIGNGLGMALGPVLGGLIRTHTGDSDRRADPLVRCEPGRGAVHPRPARHLLLLAPHLGGTAPA